MKIHEYQGKELLKKFGVPVPRGIVARTADEAFAAAQELATTPVVVKAQIHAGGRGKGGGVKLAKTPEEARDIAQKMLGMKLVTHQTGPEGREVHVLLIEEGLPIDREFYLGIVLDRATGRPVFMASAAGGMDIEEVAAKTPEKIFKETHRQRQGSNGLAKRDEDLDGVRGLSRTWCRPGLRRIRGVVQPDVPAVEQLEAVSIGAALLVREIVGSPRERIDGRHVRAHLPRHQH